MWFTSWRNLRAAGRCQAARAKPRLEALEGRCVLSPITKVLELGPTAGAVDLGPNDLTIRIPAAGVAVGHTVLVEVATNQGAPTVSDTRGNSYALDASAGNPALFIFSARVGNALNSADHIDVRFAGPVFPNLAAASAVVFSGLAIDPKDQRSTNGAGTGTAFTSNETPVTTAAKALLFGGVAASSGGILGSSPDIGLIPGAGYTALRSASATNSIGDTTLGVFPEFRIVQQTGPYAADGTLTVRRGNAVWSAGVVAYKAADQTTHFRVTSSTATPQAGVPFSVTVTALDDADAVATGYSGTVHLSSSDAQASLPADLTFTGSEGGTRTFTLTLGTAGSQTVTVTDTDPAAGYTATATVTVAQASSGNGTPGTGTPGSGTGVPGSGTGSPGPGPAVTGTPAERFVAHLYLDLLNRPVDPAGLTFWVGLIDGGLGHTQVVRAILGSTEYLTGEIRAAYGRYLHRPLDPAGWAYFFPLLYGGGAAEQMGTRIVSSPEYLRTRGVGNGDAFLDVAYHDILNRAVDPAGRLVWDRALAGGATFADVAAALFESREYDLGLVAGYFTHCLGRPLDPLGAVDFVLALQVHGARAEDVLAVVAGSPEYAARA